MQMDDVLNVKWYVVERLEKIISAAGYPEMYYEYAISTDPKHGKGIKIADVQRWGGPPGYAGFVEKAVAENIVETHNAFITETENLERRKANLRPWPKGISRRDEAGRVRTLTQAWELKDAQEKAAHEGPSDGVVTQRQPVQAEDSQV